MLFCSRIATICRRRIAVAYEIKQVHKQTIGVQEDSHCPALPAPFAILNTEPKGRMHLDRSMPLVTLGLDDTAFQAPTFRYLVLRRNLRLYNDHAEPQR